MVIRNPPRRAIYGVAMLTTFATAIFNTSWRTPPKEEPHDLINDIYNTTLGFERIFVVGLPSRTNRRDGITLQAALSDMEVEFIDGVMGENVPDDAIPRATQHDRISDSLVGSWRAHMNAIKEVVRRNLTSALIMEDDTDWDLRIRDQLRDFAIASQTLTQPLVSNGQSYANMSATKKTDDLYFYSLPETHHAKISPYGDSWDVLWLGHCGQSFASDNSKVPKARVIRHSDKTVPKKNHLSSVNNHFSLVEDFPHHTRAIHYSQEGACSRGYAISRKGARKLLYEVGLRDVTDAFHVMLRFFCEGLRGMAMNQCLTTQPGLFQQHRPAGPAPEWSGDGDQSDAFIKTSVTDMIRWSVRLNANALADGRKDYKDQFPA